MDNREIFLPAKMSQSTIYSAHMGNSCMQANTSVCPYWSAVVGPNHHSASLTTTQLFQPPLSALPMLRDSHLSQKRRYQILTTTRGHPGRTLGTTACTFTSQFIDLILYLYTQVAGHALLNKYGRQFKKLLLLLCKDYVQRLVAMVARHSLTTYTLCIYMYMYYTQPLPLLTL